MPLNSRSQKNWTASRTRWRHSVSSTPSSWITDTPSGRSTPTATGPPSIWSTRPATYAYYHFGEGGYGETERAIQALLRELNQAAVLPTLMPPVRESDAPGAVCYRVTPELYLGYQRGRIGNPASLVPKQAATYRDPGAHAEGYFYLQGEWRADDEYVMKPWGGGESSVSIRYTAKEVNLVMNPLPGHAGRLQVRLNGESIGTDNAGEDVRFEDGTAYVEIDGPRMYRLVNSPDIGSGELTLSTADARLAMYAFTFVSCVAPPEATG